MIIGKVQSARARLMIAVCPQCSDEGYQFYTMIPNGSWIKATCHKCGVERPVMISYQRVEPQSNFNVRVFDSEKELGQERHFLDLETFDELERENKKLKTTSDLAYELLDKMLDANDAWTEQPEFKKLESQFS